MAGKILSGQSVFGFPYPGAYRQKKEPNMTLEVLAQRWLNNVKFHIKESSYVKYYNLINNHIIPELGKILVTDFTTNAVENFIEERLKSGKKRGPGGLSGKTVRDILTILKEIYTFATYQGIELPMTYN